LVCSHSGPAVLPRHKPSYSYTHQKARFVKESSPSGPAAPHGRRPSYSYMSTEARFAQVSSSDFGAFAYLFVASHLSETVGVKQAGIDAPRTGLGTVLRTVQGAISTGALAGIGGGTLSAILRPVRVAVVGPFLKAMCGWALAATANPTSQPICIAIRRLTRGAISRGTFGGTCVATSTASCGSWCSNGNRATKSRNEDHQPRNPRGCGEPPRS
jgi:hypothetical protein